MNPNPWIKIVAENGQRVVWQQCKDIVIANHSLDYLKNAVGKGYYQKARIIVIIDCVEYEVSPKTNNRMEDIMDMHKSFYYEEYQKGLEKEKLRLKQDRKDRKYILLGESVRDRKGNKPLVKLSRAKSLKTIARNILIMYQWEYKYEHFLGNEKIDLSKVRRINRLRLEHPGGIVDIPFLENISEEIKRISNHGFLSAYSEEQVKNIEKTLRLLINN